MISINGAVNLITISVKLCSILLDLGKSNLQDQVGTKLLTRFILECSQLYLHKFQHNFEHTLNMLCSCNIVAETLLHFLPWHQFFNDIQEILMNDQMNIDRSVPSLSQDKLISVLLYGSDAFAQFIKDSHRFNNSLSQWCNLTLARQFWRTKVCLWVSKISKICLFGRTTRPAPS